MNRRAAAESKLTTIEAAMLDPRLLGAGFGDAKTWRQWRVVVKAAFGIALNREEARAFAAIAGGRKPPAQRVRELWCVLGRRSGKSRVAAALAVFFAAICDHSGKLAPGETGYVLIVAASKDQCKAILGYCEGFFGASPVLSSLVAEVTQDEIRLRNGVVIAVHAANYRTIRSRTLLAVIFDETAFWRSDESAQPDTEVYRATIPALATTGGMLIAISSPYRKIGLLHQRHRDYFGVDDNSVLVVQGASRAFNPTLDDDTIRISRADDPESARAEWDGEFRSDLTQFLDDATIDAAIDFARPLELPPRDGVKYEAFADASAGRHDAFCFGIGHREDGRIIADVIRGRRPPFDPATVAGEYAELAKEYRISKIVGDNFAGEWVSNSFKAAGAEYARSELPKSALYLESLPYFMRGAVSIPNLPILIKELRLLERRTTLAGKDSVDHGRSGSDDHSNVLAGIMWLLRDTTVKPMVFAKPIVVSKSEAGYDSNTGSIARNPACASGPGYSGYGDVAAPFWKLKL
jgi:hypothetical protein